LNKKLVPILLTLLLATATICLIANQPVGAVDGTGSWITYYKIENAQTNSLILEKNFQTGTTSGSGVIAEGTPLKVTFTIQIGVSNPTAKLSLSTELTKSSGTDNFWVHDTTDGYSLGNYNPNLQSFSFAENSGTLQMVCYGTVPTGKVTTTIGNVTLHKQYSLGLVVLKDPTNTILDQAKLPITDGKIDTYNTLLKEKQDKLASYQSSGVSPSFVSVYSNTINAAKDTAASGLIDNAIAILNGLNVSDPASNVMEVLFIPLIAVFAVIAVIFVVMFMRSRSKVGYYKLVVEDQIKDLEGISLRATKLDKTMGASLESVKDRLKRLVGM
jgi:hypothetical protein